MGLFNFGGGKATTTLTGKVVGSGRDFTTGIVGISVQVRRETVSLSFAPGVGDGFWSESFGKKNMQITVTIASDNPETITAYKILSFESRE